MNLQDARCNNKDKLCFVRHTNPVSGHKFKNNYEGTSGRMNVSGVLSGFNHALHTQNIYHTKTLGDGDSTADQRVVVETPYEPNIPRNKTRMCRLCTEKNGSKSEKTCERKVGYKVA